MKSDVRKKHKTDKSADLFLKELDKGINSMENGRTVPHDKAMQMMQEKLEK